MEGFNVLFSSLHHIALDSNQIISKNTRINSANTYISDLISKILVDENCRFYNVRDNSTQVINLVISLYANKDSILESALASTEPFVDRSEFLSIAKKLLHAQTIAKKRYGHLSDIKKGSLIQSLIETEDTYYYLFSLVEHSIFLDENELTLRGGLGTSKIAFKTCLIQINEDGNITSIRLTDTNKKISDYWWDDFLEIDEVRGNKKNTEVAYQLVKDAISNKLSRKYPKDYNIISNNLISYFTCNSDFHFDSMIDFLFENYTPDDNSLDLEGLKDKVTTLKNNLAFDNAFTIVPSAIKDKIRRVYEINKNINVILKGAIDQLEDTVFSTKLTTGEKAIIIKSDNDKEYEKFVYKKLEQL